jgi:hypothetical protein
MPLVIHDMDRVFSIDRPWKETLETFEATKQDQAGVLKAREMAVARTMAVITARNQALQLVLYYYLDVLNDEAMALLQLEAYKEDSEILDAMMKPLLARYDEAKTADKIASIAKVNQGGAATFKEAWMKATATRHELERQQEALAPAPASSPRQQTCKETCSNKPRTVQMPNVAFQIDAHRIEEKNVTFGILPRPESPPMCIEDCEVKVGRRGMFSGKPDCGAGLKGASSSLEKVTDRKLEFHARLCCATVKECVMGK